METKIKAIDCAGLKANSVINSLEKQIELFLGTNNEIKVKSLSHNVVFGQNSDQENEFIASAIIIYEE